MALAVNFANAGVLWLLLAPVVLVAAYMAFRRRRMRYAVRFTNLELLSAVAPRTPGWRRQAAQPQNGGSRDASS
jgi:Ca-activated chloride channel family protein